MTVREVLQLAASLLDETELVSGEGEIGSDEDLLLECFRVIENEIALDYFPLKLTEHVVFTDGKLLFTKLSRTPADVHSVKRMGRAVKFRILYDRLEADCDEADVTYSFIPKTKEITDDCDFSGKVSPRLMAYGVASEYCLAKGRYEAAKAWGLKYREALRAAGILRRALSVRSRRWA